MIFGIKQIIKMLFQQLILPVVYNACTAKPVIPGTVILADAHHDEIPFSMLAIKEELSVHPSFRLQKCTGIITNLLLWRFSGIWFLSWKNTPQRKPLSSVTIFCLPHPAKNAARHRSYSSGMHVAHSKNSAMTPRKISLPIMLAM